MRFSTLILTMLIIFATIFLLVIGWDIANTVLWGLNENNHTLNDFAYKENRNLPYTVHITENGALTPYLVLSDDYGGNCLLLREYLMEEDRIYNYFGNYSGYYEGSDIDEYLNEEFLNTLSPETAGLIADTGILIAAKENLGIGGDEVTTINRKVFLLAQSEVDRAYLKRVYPFEGNHLPYFAKPSDRIAYRLSRDEADPWWLRSACASARDLTSAISPRGSTASAPIYGPWGEYKSYVRPAFCLPGNLKVIKISGEAGDVYTLA